MWMKEIHKLQKKKIPQKCTLSSYLSICTHLSLHPPPQPLQCQLIPITRLHQTSTAAPARSHAAIQVSIINSSFNGAQCDRYSPSHCHPSRRCSLQQQLAAPHRWACALPWNELGLCMYAHELYILCACVCVCDALQRQVKVWCILVGYIWVTMRQTSGIALQSVIWNATKG